MTSRRFARAAARRLASSAPARTLPRAAPGVVGAFAAGAAAATYGLYQIREFARARVREAVAGCGGAGGGVDAFADWYYAYRTAFELMRVAGGAFAAAAVLGEPAAHRSAEAAVGRRVLDKYEALVLRPERTEPALRAALDAAAARRGSTSSRPSRAHADALPLVSAATTHVGPGAARAQRAEVLVDWSNCARRASGLERSHEPRDASSAALLAAAGAVGAKLTSSAVASKASAVAAASAGSAAVQAPRQARAIALARRPAFEADVRAAFDATVAEWASGLGDAADGACDVDERRHQLTTARDADAPPPAAAAATPAEAPEDAPPPEGAPPPPRAGVD
ncbi:hypothetical protein JL720_8170 [Aureococcus anophagefferens]|nr:hypothetical protein JL720_8170 [Aureococcus anophagefferens]